LDAAVKSGGRAETNATPAAQLAAEIEWLVNAAGTDWRPRFDTAGAVRVNCRTAPALVRPELATRIEDILYRPELVSALRIIEQHNSQPREIPGRRLPQKDHFLLGPHLFQILVSVESRKALRQRLPVLDQPAAEVRGDLRKVAADCEVLAALVRKSPQPHIALAAETNANEALKVFAPWTELFEAADGSERQIIAFSDLIGRAAGWFNALADHVQRATQNWNTNPGMLRRRVAEVFLRLFTERLGDPYYTHVAAITTIVSGTETHADFVRQMEAQQTGATRRRQTETLNRKKSDTLP
jgi:hypothetical protein